MTGINYFTSKSIYQTKSNLGYWMRKERLTHDYFLIKKKDFTKMFYVLIVLWIRIRIGSTFRSFLDPDKMEAEDVRFKILINNSETQLITNFFR